MRVKVLGCHGGELPGCRTTCLLIDGHTAIDAGALTGTLTLDELVRVDDVFLTHSHFDHVKDVPLMADLLTGRRAEPVRIRGTRACLDTLQRSIFNDELWPDFTKIPNAEKPVMRLVPLAPGDEVAARDLVFTPVSVDHPVESVGFLVRKGRTSIAISGDTGPTETFWQVVNAREDVRAVFLEMSFPNRMQWLADLSGHFTPQTVKTELAKLAHDVPVFLYHLKPAFLDELKEEVRALQIDRLRVLELDELHVFE